jgi:hypothetical protein
MNSYIEATCIGRPLDLPTWDEVSELWELFFEESETPCHPYDEDFRKNVNFANLISVSFESAQEVTDAYNYYNQNPVGGETNEKIIEQNS